MVHLFVLGLLIGLASAVHCFGMCGGITGALAFSLPRETRASRRRLLPYLGAYNLARILSYALAGALAGGIGALVRLALGEARALPLLGAVGIAAMVALGLHLGGWLPRYARIERLGEPLWRHIDPLGRRLLPVHTVPRAFLYGLVWGWLPCGVVYGALLMAVGSGSPAGGALFMAALGLGTLPGVMTMGLFAGWALSAGRRPRLQRFVGVVIIVTALLGFVFQQLRA